MYQPSTFVFAKPFCSLIHRRGEILLLSSKSNGIECVLNLGRVIVRVHVINVSGYGRSERVFWRTNVLFDKYVKRIKFTYIQWLQKLLARILIFFITMGFSIGSTYRSRSITNLRRKFFKLLSYWSEMTNYAIESDLKVESRAIIDTYIF